MMLLKNCIQRYKIDLLFYIIILLSFFFTQSQIAPAPDTTWLMLCAEKWLQGGSYYNHFMEVNPPASILLHAPIFFLQNIFSSTSILNISFYYFSFLIFFSMGLCLSLKILFERKFKHEIYSFLFISILLMALMLPNISFGQRDYILFITTLPYILCHLMRTYNIKTPLSLEWGCYIWAGIFMVLKPHFYIVIIGLSLFRSYIRKDIFQIIKDPSNYIIGTIAIIYLACIYLFFPEFLTLIFTDVIGIYINGSVNMFANFWIKIIEFIILLIILPLLISCIKDKVIRYISVAMIFLSVLFFIGFILQHKGFPYHYLPAQILLYSNILVIFFGLSKRFLSGAESKIFSYGIILYCIFLFVEKNSNLEHSTIKYEQSEKISYLNENVKTDEYYSFLQRALGISTPAYYYTQGKWGSRFPALWFMNDLLEEKKQNRNSNTNDNFQETYKKYQNLVTEDLKNNKPKLVLIPVESRFFEFMSDSENFQTIWKQYKYKEQKTFPVAQEIYNRPHKTIYDVYCLDC